MKNDKIYYIKDFNELLPFLNEKTPDYKKILNVYSILGEYDKIYELISKVTKNKNLDKKNMDIMNYYLCVYYWHENNKYASDKCYYKLDEISKRKIEYGRCNYVNEYNELYDKYFIDNNYYKDYGVIYYYLYLCNFLRKDIRVDNKLNKKIIKHITRILNKSKLSMYDIDYFAAVINISYNYYTIFYKKEVEFPVSLDLLEKMCDKTSKDILLYSEMLKNRLIELNEGILLGYRALITLTKDKDTLEVLLKRINDFIKTRELKEYTKFVYSITKDKNSDNVDKYVEEIKKIASGESEGEILRTIIIYCVNANEKELRTFYNIIKDIECKRENKQLIEELKLGKLILRFWLGETINVEQLNENIFLSDFLRLIIEFDCKKINYQQFIKMLEVVNDVDIELILNWQRLDNIFYNCDYEWLKLILSKCNYVNNKTINYLFNNYIRIVNREDKIEFYQFKELDEIVCEKCNNVDITILSVWIYFNIYNENNTSILDKLYYILNNNKKINLDAKDLQSFAIIMVLHLVYDNIKIDVGLVKRFIEENCTNIEKTLCLLALYYIDKSSLTIKDYYKCLKNVALIYSENCNIDTQLQFSLINLLAAKDLIDKDYINIGVNDIIYLDNNKKIVLSTDYDEKFKKYYDLLGVEEKEDISEAAEKTTLLETFAVRIYFENIEKFNAGKMILLKQGLDGKQILEELLNVTGYKQNQEIIKQIKNGKIVKQLWLNVYTIHQYMKDVKSEVDFKYSNSINRLLGSGKKVIHITSVALLAKIGIIDKIVENDDYYVQGYILDEFEKMKKNGVQDLVDGILEKEICYDDLISDIYNTLVKLDDKERIEYVTTANTLGLENPSIINQYDIEILKLLIDYKKVPFMLITEDPFYCKNDPTNSISASTYSLVIDMYVNQIIDSKQLLAVTRKLKELNYNLYVRKDIYYYFLNNSDDNNISEVIDILNEFN